MFKLAPAIDSVHMGRISKAEKFLSFLTQNGSQVIDAPCRYVNISSIQSNILNLMKIIKISKSCVTD